MNGVHHHYCWSDVTDRLNTLLSHPLPGLTPFQHAFSPLARLSHPFPGFLTPPKLHTRPTCFLTSHSSRSNATWSPASTSVILSNGFSPQNSGNTFDAYYLGNKSGVDGRLSRKFKSAWLSPSWQNGINAGFTPEPYWSVWEFFPFVSDSFHRETGK